MKIGRTKMLLRLFLFPSIVLFSFNSESNSIIDKVFEKEESNVCGVKSCENQIIYSICKNAACGVTSRTENCGVHWTRWAAIGREVRNPCPTRCRRGPEVGKSLRTIDSRTDDNSKIQTRHKFQCFRDVKELNTCAHKACGIKKGQNTGKAVYASCSFPLNNLDQTAFDNQLARASDPENLVLTLLRKINSLAGDTVDTSSEFFKAVKLSTIYVENFAWVFPEESVYKIRSITRQFEQKGKEVTEADIISEIGSHSVVRLKKLSVEPKYQCEAGE